jgi:hypothetical protein
MNPNSSTTNSSIPGAQDRPDLERHARKCEICHHPNREEIEEGFVNWRPADRLARVFNVQGQSDAIYRHASALGLYDRRLQNSRRVVELIMECATLCNPSASDVLRAFAIHARLTGQPDVSIPHTLNIIVTRRWEPAPESQPLQEAPTIAVALEPLKPFPPQSVPRPESSEEQNRRFLIAEQKH